MKYIKEFNISFIDYHKNLSYFNQIKVGRFYFKYPDYDKNRIDYENIFKIKKLSLNTNTKNILCNMIVIYCENNSISNYNEGEDFFIKYATNDWCIYYAKRVIKSRWLKIESRMFSKVKSTYDYCLFFNVPTDPKIIKKMSESSLYSYKYSRYIIQGRLKELEDSILKNDYVSFLYFKYVLKKNWSDNQDIKNDLEKSICSNFSYTKKYLETYKRKFNKIYEEDFFMILEKDFFMIYDKYKNDKRLPYFKRLFHFKKK